MKFSQAATALAMAGSATAFWRMPCRSRTGLGRLDPIVDRGQISGHVHAIHGGGNFGFDTTFEDLTADDSCTSCGVSQDHSAYWTPAMYFMYDNGTTVLVPQVGGMLAYYLYYLDEVKSFPEGFEMLAGTPGLRNFSGPEPDIELSQWPQDPSDQAWLEQRALGFNCLNYARTPEASLYRHQMPPKEYMDANCKDGMRLELGFPSCGNGEKTSDDHKSHVAFPSLVKEGNCPDSHPIHYPFLFYETIWATNAFIGESGQFMLSNGDPTGCGYHGDFIMGWESSEFLQTALDTCTSSSGQIEDCPVFDIQDDATSAKCEFKMPSELADEQCDGPREGLPVNVPIQYGPDRATPYPIAGRKGNPTTSLPSTATAPTSTIDSTALSYSAADPSETETAPGGIIVAVASDGSGGLAEAEPMSSSDSPAAPTPEAPATTSSSSSSSSSSSPSVITAAPSYQTPSSDADDAEAITTKYMTNGNEVVEMVIEEVEITVTATATASPAGGSYKHRRHLHNHLHQHNIR